MSGARPCRDVWGAYAIRPYPDTAKPAEDCTKNRFGAPNDPRIASKTEFKPAATLILGQKSIWGPRRPSFWAKNRFGARGEGHFAPKTGFRSAATLISHLNV